MVRTMNIEIKTKHLNLKLLEEKDLPWLAELNQDPEVRQFFPDGIQDTEQTERRMRDFISWYDEKGLPCFVMFLSDSKEFVGRCGFGPVETGEIEAGYLLLKKFWGRGFATEALAALLEWAKHHIKTEYIIAFAPVDHIASQRVMQKCGMEHYKNDLAHGVECCFYRFELESEKILGDE